MRLLFLIVTLFFTYFLQGQYFIEGKVINQTTSDPLEFTTVIIMNSNDSSYIKGTTTDIQGRFRIESDNKNIIVEVSFMGYETSIIDSILFNQRVADLGEIELIQNSLQLEEVVLTAEKSTTEFKLDKRVFNVGSDLSSTGANALEVLNNVPSDPASLKVLAASFPNTVKV